VTWARPRLLILLLAAVTVVPMGVLGWLTSRVVTQDRDVERQRRSDALELEARRVVIDIDRRLKELETELAQGQGVRLTKGGLVAPAGTPVLFQPEPPAVDTRDAMFLAADADEQQGRLTTATTAVLALARSTDVAVRANALLRLGRIRRKAADTAGALDAYARLESLGSTMAAGVPASLIASFARGRMAEDAGDRAVLTDAGTTLAAKLARGGWAIDGTTFDSYSEAAVRWGGAPPDPGALARTDAAIALWRQWRSGALPLSGRRVLGADEAIAFGVWATGTDEVTARILTTTELAAWLQRAWSDRAVAVAAFEADGPPLFGAVSATGVSLMPRDTALPFVVNVASTDDGRGTSSRMGVFLTGVGLACALMLAAAVGLYRTTMRQVSLARQQADFVSAVSHEFRTPLTSMRHILDVLANRGVPNDDRRAHYYGLLTGETERLHRMVESLLSFGRIEAGAYSWQLEPTDVAALVEKTVQDFRREPLARGRDVRLDLDAGLPAVMADREALSRALWNLVENAAKYSEPPAPMIVFARAAATGVELGVRDHGPGIEPAEQQRIFEKFVRGAGARHAGARGVGIGLALVRMIVSAHRGTLSLQSTPGHGSTFTIVLPTPPPGPERSADADASNRTGTGPRGDTAREQA
jgi:signal transduction histidine kinase